MESVTLSEVLAEMLGYELDLSDLKLKSGEDKDQPKDEDTD